MLTAYLHNFTHEKISYRLYNDDLYICLLHFVPSDSYKVTLSEICYNKNKWAVWIKEMYKDAHISLKLHAIGKYFEMYLVAINLNCTYKINRPYIIDSEIGYYWLEAFENRSRDEDNTKVYEFFLQLVMTERTNNRLKIEFK